MQIAWAALTVILLAVTAGCGSEDAQKPRDARSVAEAQSRLATTPEQSRLWQKAGDAEMAGGLDQIPVVEQPVTQRPRITVADRKEPRAAPVSAPSPTGVRILAAPELPDGSFTGAAKVLRADGEQLDLDLGDKRILSLLVRAAGASLRATTGAFGRLDLRVRDDPHARREIIAVRLENGDGILSVIETGLEPVAVEVPLFELTARQVGEAKGNALPVEIRVGKESRTLTQGQTAEFPGSRIVVGVVSSVAYTGAAAARAEGRPFALGLKAWPAK
jgi:hypothetical protein